MDQPEFWNNLKVYGKIYTLFCQGVILVNAFFIVFMLLYTFIILQIALPDFSLSHSLQLVICAFSFTWIGIWFAKNIRNPAVIWLYIGLFLLYTILRNNHIILSSQIKGWFSWIYPLHALINGSPTAVYVSEHGLDGVEFNSKFYDLISIFPMSTIWGILTAYVLIFVLISVFIFQFFRGITQLVISLKNRKQKYSKTPLGNQTQQIGSTLGWKDLFRKKQWVIFWIPILIFGLVNQANSYGFGQQITINPGVEPIRLSLYGLPAELDNSTLNKTWIDDTIEGQRFINQLARYNTTIYISTSASSLNSPEKKDAWADYIDYLFQRGIRVSFDGWCNIKYYYDSWRPLFREVVNFRTNPLYMDRLHGLEGISGDFETNSPTGMDAQLFEDVYHNVTAELIWMKQRMTAVNLTSAEFKFGSISGVELDVIDNDEDVSIFFESWPILNYDFDAPMFYRGANWMSSLNYYFQLQQWFHTTYNPDVEKRVLLGISGRGNYIAEAGIGEIVKEINIARSWGVKEVGFFHGYSPDGMLYCMEGAQGLLNGTEMTITKENVLEVIMEAVYLNQSFQIPVRSPIVRGVIQDHTAYDDFWDAFNLDFLNMLNPYGYVYYDLYLNLDHGFGITHILGIASFLISLLVLKILKKYEKCDGESHRVYI